MIKEKLEEVQRKIDAADVVIDNDGSIAGLRDRVAEFWAGLGTRREGEGT